MEYEKTFSTLMIALALTGSVNAQIVRDEFNYGEVKQQKMLTFPCFFIFF